ncbi:MAG: hypothetical protein JW801_16475 [Bacteroidales bacterium]|nr:hypothetical protein [Bacteroidales bacterium]
MRRIDTSLLTSDECWAVQISGLQHCESCKFVGLTACMGQNIRKTGKNNKGVVVGIKGIAVQ